MIRFINIFLLLVLSNTILHAQSNIFDCNNSRDFARYLYNTDQFELAQHELERISFFCDIDSASQLLLLKSYRKLKNYNKANVFYIGKTIADIQELNPSYRMEYVRLLMAQNEYSQVKKAINNGLDFKEKYEHQIGTALLMQQWEEAYKISQQENAINNFKIEGLRKVAHDSYLSKRKKPLLATLMSILVPGSGKMYCGYWGDGAISFLFTASSTFFAYRAFNKYGPDKVYPWVIGGLAVSYYAGNVYGGNRAAINYNEKLNHEYIHETEHILYSDY